MTQLKITVLVLMTSLIAIASQNPQIQACHNAGGIFFVANTSNDQVGLCGFDESTIGAIDILNRDNLIERPLSISTYSEGITECAYSNKIGLKTFEGGLLWVCRFNDGSILDLETLKTGKTNIRNYNLNKALSL